MKAKIGFIVVILILMLKTTAYAADTQVETKINGSVKKGSTVDIQFNVKDVSRFYAGSIEVTYDPAVIKVESVNGGEFIKTNNPKIMEFGGETAKNGNIANYYFTCVGKVDGFTGSGNFVVIKANILNEEKFALYSKNIKLQLVERTTNNEMKDIKFTITGDVKNEEPPKTDGAQKNTDSSASNWTKTENVNKNEANTQNGSVAEESNNTKTETKNETDNSKNSDSESKSEDKGFISNIIDKIKSVFTGSSDKDNKNTDEKKSDNTKEEKDNKENKSGVSSNDNKSVDNSKEQAGTANQNNQNENTSKDNPSAVKSGNENKEADSKADKINVASSAKSSMVKVGTSILVAVLIGAASIYYYKRKVNKR